MYKVLTKSERPITFNSGQLDKLSPVFNNNPKLEEPTYFSSGQPDELDPFLKPEKLKESTDENSVSKNHFMFEEPGRQNKITTLSKTGSCHNQNNIDTDTCAQEELGKGYLPEIPIFRTKEIINENSLQRKSINMEEILLTSLNVSIDTEEGIREISNNYENESSEENKIPYKTVSSLNLNEHTPLNELGTPHLNRSGNTFQNNIFIKKNINKKVVKSSLNTSKDHKNNENRTNKKEYQITTRPKTETDSRLNYPSRSQLGRSLDNQSAYKTLNDLSNQPAYKHLNELGNRPENKPLNQLGNQPAHKPIHQSRNQPAYKPLNHLDNQPEYEPLNQFRNQTAYKP